jgi:hypothetical protein
MPLHTGVVGSFTTAELNAINTAKSGIPFQWYLNSDTNLYYFAFPDGSLSGALGASLEDSFVVLKSVLAQTVESVLAILGNATLETPMQFADFDWINDGGFLTIQMDSPSYSSIFSDFDTDGDLGWVEIKETQDEVNAPIGAYYAKFFPTTYRVQFVDLPYTGATFQNTFTACVISPHQVLINFSAVGVSRFDKIKLGTLDENVSPSFVLVEGADGSIQKTDASGIGGGYDDTAINARVDVVEAVSIIEINQVGHGFAVLQPVHRNASGWIGADTANFADGLVIEVVDANVFKVQVDGMIALSSHGKTIGSIYYTPNTAGQATTTAPSISQPLYKALSSDVIVINMMRPST